jgi:hypothetical protein
MDQVLLDYKLQRSQSPHESYSCIFSTETERDRRIFSVLEKIAQEVHTKVNALNVQAQGPDLLGEDTWPEDIVLPLTTIQED